MFDIVTLEEAYQIGLLHLEHIFTTQLPTALYLFRKSGVSFMHRFLAVVQECILLEDFTEFESVSPIVVYSHRRQC